MKTDLTECPRCHETGGFYEKHIVCFNHFFSYTDRDSLGRSDETHIKGGKKQYCGDCHFDITKHFYEETKTGK